MFVNTKSDVIRNNICSSVQGITPPVPTSPVDRWTTPYRSLIMLHCVPFPDAGAPAMIILGAGDDPAAASMAILSLLVADVADEAPAPTLLSAEEEGTHALPHALPLEVPVVGAKVEAGRLDTEAEQSEDSVLVGTPPNQPRVSVLLTGGTKAESLLVLAVAEAVAMAVAAAPSAPAAAKAAVRHATRPTRTRPRHIVVRMRDGMVPAALFALVPVSRSLTTFASGGSMIMTAVDCCSMVKCAVCKCVALVVHTRC